MKHVPDLHGEPLSVAPAELRQFVEAEIERLLAFLDGLDGDVDLEPSLTGYAPGMDDREGDPADDRLAEDADDEPSLGFLEEHHYQQGLSRGAYADSDIEDEHDGSEPSLGWTTGEASRGRSYAGSYGRGVDLEEQCEDEGAVFAFP